MGEENPSANRAKAAKFSDQNQAPKSQNRKTSSNPLKQRSSWGSHIVKGFTADKKTKVQTAVPAAKKLPPTSSDIANQKNPLAQSHSRVKRSLIGDLSCSVNATQVHPQAYQTHRRQSSGSRDLFIELDHLRSLLQESKEREFKLQAELSEWKRNPNMFDHERELKARKDEVNELAGRVELLENEKATLSQQLAALTVIIEKNEEAPRRDANESSMETSSSSSNLEMEVVELRRLSKDLQMEKRNLACKLSYMESQLASLTKASEIKADVETQGEFVNSLIREVNNAVYRNIEDVVAFVKWLDDELCFLVDERAVLKHFDWPEKKADTLREAAFGYRDLKKLETEVSYYKDDPRLRCDIALKKMIALSEKMERTIYNLLRTRDSLMRNCKDFQIPTDWMLDNGIITKIKFGSVKLAKKYMKRVAMELQSKAALEKDPSMDYMLLQGVRFAFRIHQFAGGFDAETMHAFEELRNLANLLSKSK